MRLSIIIPCLNEHATIEQLLDRVAACPHEPKDIVVVDDGSTDGTRQLLANLVKLAISGSFHTLATRARGPRSVQGSLKRWVTSSSCRTPILNMIRKRFQKS